MTIENKILRDLKSGQSTAGAIADRLRLREGVVKTICDRLVNDKKLQTRPLQCLTIYHLP